MVVVFLNQLKLDVQWVEAFDDRFDLVADEVVRGQLMACRKVDGESPNIAPIARQSQASTSLQY
jgi:hypothetical protein